MTPTALGKDHFVVYKCANQLPPAVSSALTERPIKQFLDKVTLGHVKQLQKNDGAVTVTAFLTLQLRAPDPVIYVKQLDRGNFTMSTMTCAQLYAAVWEKRQAKGFPEGKDRCWPVA